MKTVSGGFWGGEGEQLEDVVCMPIAAEKKQTFFLLIIYEMFWGGVSNATAAPTNGSENAGGVPVASVAPGESGGAKGEENVGDLEGDEASVAAGIGGTGAGKKKKKKKKDKKAEEGALKVKECDVLGGDCFSFLVSLMSCENHLTCRGFCSFEQTLGGGFPVSFSFFIDATPEN